MVALPSKPLPAKHSKGYAGVTVLIIYFVVLLASCTGKSQEPEPSINGIWTKAYMINLIEI